MNTPLHLHNGLSIRFLEPGDSDRLFSMQLGEQATPISSEDAGLLYLWLHEHRETFVSFYAKGWDLARRYWQAEGAPTSYSDRLAIFNTHCHEIGVAPYDRDGTGPSERAVNGFFAAIGFRQETGQWQEPPQSREVQP